MWKQAAGYFATIMCEREESGRYTKPPAVQRPVADTMQTLNIHSSFSHMHI